MIAFHDSHEGEISLMDVNFQRRQSGIKKTFSDFFFILMTWDYFNSQLMMSSSY